MNTDQCAYFTFLKDGSNYIWGKSGTKLKFGDTIHAALLAVFQEFLHIWESKPL